MQATTERDLADLVPALEEIAAKQLVEARKQLARRGEEEAKSLASLLDTQRSRIAKASADAEKDDPNQFQLPGVLDEEVAEHAGPNPMAVPSPGSRSCRRCRARSGRDRSDA